MSATDKQRLLYEKKGRAAYISHLDLMRTMQRSFLRAGAPLMHSRGFNPHPVMTVALPLPVGHESLCELLEFEPRDAFPPEALAEALNRALPEGLRALEIYPALRRHKEIKWLRWEGIFEYGESAGAVPAPEEISAFFANSPIIVTKKTKRGEGEADIAPMIKSLAATAMGGRCLRIGALLCAQEPTLNPDLLTAALFTHAPRLAPDFCAFTRLEVYAADMSVFR